MYRDAMYKMLSVSSRGASKESRPANMLERTMRVVQQGFSQFWSLGDSFEVSRADQKAVREEAMEMLKTAAYEYKNNDALLKIAETNLVSRGDFFIYRMIALTPIHFSPVWPIRI